MKNTITRWMIAAAALAAVAGSAAAQTYKAEIPLSFRVRDKLMRPGSYRIDLGKMSASGSFYLYNEDTKASVSAVALRSGGVSKAWREGAAPVLAFRCEANVCALDRMWNGSDTFAYRFSGARMGDDVRIAVVALTPVKGD